MAKAPKKAAKAPPKPKAEATDIIPGVVDAAGNAIRQESSIHGG